MLPNCLYIMFYHFAHVFVHPSLKKLSFSEEKIQIPYRKSISHVLYGSYPTQCAEEKSNESTKDMDRTFTGW